MQDIPWPVAAKQGIKRREHKQRQQCRADQPANHNGCDWPLNFRSRAGSQGHRHEAERSHNRRHRDRPQSGQRALMDGSQAAAALFHQLLDEGQLASP
jgi:hypothetical protein